MLEVVHVQKVYRRGNRQTPALADLHFQVEQDEIVSIVGPSGCGRTTMPRCIAGLLPPTSGLVLLDGRRVMRPPKEMVLVFQDYGRALCPWRSVRGNVSFALEATDLPRPERNRRIHEALARVGLADFAGHYPFELSGGMQQRLQIARALAYRPTILLMDEPFGSLDIGITNTFSHVLAKDSGLDLKMVAQGSVETTARPTHAILVKPDSPITTAGDIKGKTIGINTLNNIDHVMVQEWLEKQGGDPKDATFLELPFPQHAAALTQGRFDMSAPTEPFVTVAEQQGARVVARHYVEVNDRTQIAYFVAGDAWLQKNPDVARRFAAAVHRGNQFVMENEQEARAIAVRQLKLDPAVAGTVVLGEMLTKAEPDLIKWWIDTGVKRGLIKRSFDPDELLHETVR